MSIPDELLLLSLFECEPKLLDNTDYDCKELMSKNIMKNLVGKTIKTPTI